MDIISLTTGLVLSGFILNKDKKYPRNSKIDDIISENEIPNGENIYESIDLKKNTEKIQSTLNERYSFSLDPNNTLVHPNSYYIKNGQKSDPSLFFPLKEKNQSTNEKQEKGITSNINPYQDESPFSYRQGSPVIIPKPTIPEKIVFTNGIPQKESNSPFVEFFDGTQNENIPIHSNMQPYYSGSQPKQPTYESINKVNNGFYKPPKREVETLFKPSPENIYTKIGDDKSVSINKEFVDNSLTGRQNNFNPFLEEKQPPLITDKVSQIGTPSFNYRFIPKMIENLFVNSREVITQNYSSPAYNASNGKTIIPENIRDKLKPNSYNNQENFTGIKSYLTKRIANTEDTKTKEKVLNENYNPTKSAPVKGMYKTEYQEKLPFKISYTNDFNKNNESIVKDNTILFKESFNPLNNERSVDKPNTYRAPAKNLIEKPRLNLDPETRKTIKETTIHFEGGFANSYLKKRIYTDNITARTTQKENTISNDYFNLPKAPNVTPSKKVIGKTKLNQDREKTQVNIGSRILNITPRKLNIQDTQYYKENNRVQEQAISSFTQMKKNQFVPFFMVPKLTKEN